MKCGAARTVPKILWSQSDGIQNKCDDHVPDIRKADPLCYSARINRANQNAGAVATPRGKDVKVLLDVRRGGNNFTESRTGRVENSRYVLYVEGLVAQSQCGTMRRVFCCR